MLTKTIKYTDYDGKEREEIHYFNLSKAECIEMEHSISGGLSAMLKKLIEGQNEPEMFKIIKEFIMKSYGEKSPDGKRFIKSEELSIAFTQTEAYTVLLLEICKDAESAANFFKAIIPSN